jgi:hypothetical protein
MNLQNLDRWIARSLERISASIAGGSQPKEALEIRREILNEIRDKIEAKGGGEYIFPYQQIDVRINAVDDEQRDTFEAAFVDEGGLAEQVKELLAEAGCKGEVAVTVDVRESGGEPYVIECRRAPKTPAPPPPPRPSATIQVIAGKSTELEYRFNKDTIYLGRLKEVASRDGGVRRRNDVAFDEAEVSVSREHAHIEYADGKFRLFRDRGENPTRLFRDGRAVSVPAIGRGAQLRAGDEIHLGEARLRFDIGA